MFEPFVWPLVLLDYRNLSDDKILQSLHIKKKIENICNIEISMYVKFTICDKKKHTLHEKYLLDLKEDIEKSNFDYFFFSRNLLILLAT